MLNKNKCVHILLGTITTLYRNTVSVWFLELQVTFISTVVGTCTISIKPGDICKQRYFMLPQTASESFAPIYFHDLGRTSAIPTAFLHGSPQPLMAHVAVVLCTKLNIHMFPFQFILSLQALWSRCTRSSSWIWLLHFSLITVVPFSIQLLK